MPVAAESALNILSTLGRNPAVAFHEAPVASAIKSILAEGGLATEPDAFGNIICRLPGQDPGETPLALVAHMDHPGFEAVDYQGDFLIADALGGIPEGAFAEGVPVRLLLPNGERLAGTVAGKFGDEADRRALIRLEHPQTLDLPRPVVFDLPDFQLDGDYIRMRAADDLAGCASILTALTVLSQDGQPPGDVYGVFTRAEEVGLVGARLMAQGWDAAPGNPGGFRRIKPNSAGRGAGAGTRNPGGRRRVHLQQRGRKLPGESPRNAASPQSGLQGPTAAHERRSV